MGWKTQNETVDVNSMGERIKKKIDLGAVNASCGDARKSL